MGILDSIIRGFGMGAGAHLATKGIDAAEQAMLEEKAQEEAKARAASLKRWLAGGAIVLAGLGLIALYTSLLRNIVGILLVGLLGAGAWYLIRPRLAAFKTQREAKRTARIEEKKAAERARTVEEQLAELKRKKREL